MKNLLVDIGNSDICYCVATDSKLSSMSRVKTIAGIDALFDDLAGENIDCACLCSVVPNLTNAVCEKISVKFGVDVFVVTYKSVEKLLDFDYDDVSTIGSDRLADCVAMKEIYGCPSIVCDFGTATNIEVLDDFGTFIGGILCPGVEISRNALTSHAAKLSDVELTKPNNILGKNTSDALRSGILYGEAKKIDGLILQIISEYDNCITGDLKVVATGGLAQLIAKNCALVEYIDDKLTLKGLAIILKSITNK